MDAGEEDATLFLVFLAIGFVSYIFALYALLIKHYLVGVVVVLGLFAIVALLDLLRAADARGANAVRPRLLWRVLLHALGGTAAGASVVLCHSGLPVLQNSSSPLANEVYEIGGHGYLRS